MRITDTFSKVETMNVEDAKKLLAEKKEDEMALIDVREPEEYKQGHIPGARLIPLSDILDRLKELDPSKPALAYCRMGNRSRSAAALMMTQGFNKVYSIAGGITAWNGLVATGEYETGMFLLEGKKTPEEFLSLAWALEEGTRLFYKQTGDIVLDERAKKIFALLVNAEENHKAAISAAYKQFKGSGITDDKLKEMSLEGFMEGGVSIEESVSWLKQKDRKLQDILEYSMQIETNSLDLYTKILRQMENEEAKKVFNAILDEEKVHLSRLGDLLNERIADE